MTGFKPHLGIVSIGADDPVQLQAFYAAAFSDDLWGRNLTNYNVSFSSWISAGVKLSVCSRHHQNDKVMFHMIVESLEATTKAVDGAGGKLVAGPFDIPVAASVLNEFSDNYERMRVGQKSDVTSSMGKTCIYHDPEGNPFGAMQLEAWAYKLFSGAKIGKFEIAESAVGRKVSEAFHASNPP